MIFVLFACVATGLQSSVDEPSVYARPINLALYHDNDAEMAKVGAAAHSAQEALNVREVITNHAVDMFLEDFDAKEKAKTERPTALLTTVQSEPKAREWAEQANLSFVVFIIE